MSIELSPGAVVAGRYQLEKLLGEGGMGAVWSGFHLVTKKRVALKFLKGTQNDKVVRRFLREARAVSAVQHPNVIGVHDVLELPDGSPVMVMDFLPGENLAAKLAREGYLSLGEAARILVPVISAVATAHTAGIVHRDLKPENIMLHRHESGETEPKVLDFGIAKLSSAEGPAAATADLTQTGAMLGTPYYMAPEQVFGESDVDHRVDVWAVGVILYECLSGKKPFTGENFGQIFKAIALGSATPLGQMVQGLPPEILTLVARLLEPRRDLRSPNLKESYDVLRRYTSVEAISFDLPQSMAGPVTPVLTPRADSVDAFSQTEPSGETQPRGRAPWVLALSAVLVVGGAGTVVWMQDRAPALDDEVPSASTAGHGPPMTGVPPLRVEPPRLPAAADGGVRVAPSSAPSTPTPPGSGSSLRSTRPPRPPLVTPRADATTPQVTPVPDKLPGNVVEKPPF